ncbi:MAG: hypothetical protein JEZ04_21665 [Spirochaetales bacterium]|nr:hypothetical protein [Spirochaetales bacterium]
MSRVIHIKGSVIIENIEIARKALSQSLVQGITIEEKRFVFNNYDNNDGYNKKTEIGQVETIYQSLLNEYYQLIAEEKRLLEEKIVEEKLFQMEQELKRLDELNRLEEEKIRIESEKRVIREQKKEMIIKNAKKQGYIVKKEITKNNTIKLVLQRRVY